MLLHGSGRPDCVVVGRLGDPVYPDVDEHLFLPALGLEHARVVGQGEGTQPDRVDRDLSVEEEQTLFQIGDGNKHVLRERETLNALLSKSNSKVPTEHFTIFRASKFQDRRFIAV